MRHQALALVLLVACAESTATPQSPQVVEVGAVSQNGTKPSGPAGDRDGDGIADDQDKCPADAEDHDGFEDTDGCPDPDNDRDSVIDVNDRCPNDPGPPPSGCPKKGRGADADGDGILDANDKCPDEPEDRDGFEDEDGCPDVDNDRDGIPDVKDLCPNDPETVNGYQDEDGCPDVKPKKP